LPDARREVAPPEGDRDLIAVVIGRARSRGNRKLALAKVNVGSSPWARKAGAPGGHSASAATLTDCNSYSICNSMPALGTAVGGVGLAGPGGSAQMKAINADGCHSDRITVIYGERRTSRQAREPMNNCAPPPGSRRRAARPRAGSGGLHMHTISEGAEHGPPRPEGRGVFENGPPACANPNITVCGDPSTTAPTIVGTSRLPKNNLAIKPTWAETWGPKS